MSREVPEGWRLTTFSDIASNVSARNRSRDEIPVLSVTKYDGFVPSEEYFKKKVFSADTENYKIVRKGQFAYATIHLDEGSIDRLTRFDVGLISPMYTVFEVDERQADPDFILRFFKFYATNGQFDALGNGGVNRRKSISFSTLGRLSIALPSLHEQRRIAEILSSVDEAIASTRSVMEQTRKLKQGVLERLLTKGIGHTRFKQTGIGEIPEGWEIVRLNHIAERTTYGFTNPMSTVEDGPWMITAANILEGKINYKTARKTDRIEFETLLSEKSKPAENTVLITKDGTLGRVAIVDKGDLCINQSVAAVTPIEWRILPRFLYWLLQSPSVQTRILAEAGGSTIKHIYISKLAETVLQLPPLNEQEEIVRNIDLVELSFEREHSHFGALVAFKAALMSDLLTGRKRVTDALPMAAE
ncbi:restriction endonuclease subunit S [Agrobacterium radiobacter]|uniref:restriction endonuclease subunit S n=1 Tax=Agrobacterium radiobacter TaxID=362 RepID=UPI000DDFE2DB